jgi:uncharacterized protein
LNDELINAVKAYDESNFEIAFGLFKRLAELDIAEAQCYLATMYQCGLGVKENGMEAIKLYRTVAKRNIKKGSLSGIAYNNLATIYTTGLPDIPPDESKAKKYKNKAIELGFTNI